MTAALMMAAVCAVFAQARPPAKPAPSLSPKAPLREQPVPFKTGETLTYDVGWSSFLTAGTVTVAVIEKRPSSSSTAYAILAEGRPSSLLSRLYSVSYKTDTLLDARSLLPQRGSLFSQEGRRQRTKVTTFDHAARKARYEVRTATLVRKDIAIESRTLDALSALYVLRASPLRTGDRFNMSICDNGNLYKVSIAVGGPELITTGIGEISALRVTPTIDAPAGESPGRGFVIWFSNDARRLPVRMEAQFVVGQFTLVLRQASGA